LGLADSVTAVGWALRGPTFSVGTNNGEVHLWDISKLKKVRVLHGHSNRVSAISWNSSIVSSGSRDKTILHHDPRCSNNFVTKLVSHKQ
jgi:cell division cycle 20-like protein 1 (cofactor of APC complex)